MRDAKTVSKLEQWHGNRDKKMEVSVCEGLLNRTWSLRGFDGLVVGGWVRCEKRGRERGVKDEAGGSQLWWLVEEWYL